MLVWPLRARPSTIGDVSSVAAGAVSSTAGSAGAVGLRAVQSQFIAMMAAMITTAAMMPIRIMLLPPLPELTTVVLVRGPAAGSRATAGSVRR